MSINSRNRTLYRSVACLRAFFYRNGGFNCHGKCENICSETTTTFWRLTSQGVLRSENMADDDALSDSLSLESHEIDDDSFNEADSNEEMSGDDSIGGYQGAIQPYMFEPVDDNVAQHEDEDESEPDDDSARLQQNISEWYVSLFIVVIEHLMTLLKLTLF